MAIKVVGTIHGAKAIQDALLALGSDRKGRAVVRKAVVAGNKVLLKLEKSLVPVKTRLLQRGLGEKVHVISKKAIAIGISGARRGVELVPLSGRFTAFTKKNLAALRALRKRTNMRFPTRYAHLAGPGRKQRFMTMSQRLGAKRAIAEMQKIIMQEYLFRQSTGFYP